ncbi:MAG TPA: GNAT family N-acetyltransferase [Acidimicrobiia bacterium]|nr:GNAT family N-acetyltransferase [Acidimicrobiia bacterium]
MTSALGIRRARPADRAAILALLAASLGRDASDPRYDDLFAWKHEQNPVGPSPIWVATDGNRVAGVRVMMRWEFHLGARRLRAVRAVDTATHPDYQGQGIFTRLTLHAIEELRDEGLDFVFNTPNDQSLPGYLKMGWQTVGRLPTAVRPTSVAAISRIIAARVPAERWSLPATVGVPARRVLDQPAALDTLVNTQPVPEAVTTRRDARYLQWRYGTPLLGYRAVTTAEGPSAGVAFVRMRARGPARELVVADVLVPGARRALDARLMRELARGTEADYLIRLGGGLVSPGPMLRLPGQGPLLTWRAVCEPLVPRRWALTLGDIELF